MSIHKANKYKYLGRWMNERMDHSQEIKWNWALIRYIFICHHRSIIIFPEDDPGSPPSRHNAPNYFTILF